MKNDSGWKDNLSRIAEHTLQVHLQIDMAKKQSNN